MRSPRSLSRRLAEVLARPAPARPPLVFGRRPRPRGVSSPEAGPSRPVRLEEEVPGRVVEVPGIGRAWVIERNGEASGPSDGTERLCFFDIEATGLSSSPLFLIGAMTREGDRLRVRQFLARDYSEEGAAVALFAEEAGRAERLVSFNGRSYDLPYVRMRAAANRVPFDLDPPHTDLLHEARRAWRDRLPNCRLQTLEREILGRPRAPGDIPGAEIPDSYHAFVRTGDARDLVRILVHNHRDLVTLADLLAILGG